MLFRIIDDLKAQGVGIVYISHRLEELIRIGDYITVLRDGSVTGARSMEGVDIPWIVAGDDRRQVEGFFREPRSRLRRGGVPRRGHLPAARWAAASPSIMSRFRCVAGEILGLYGLMGAGRTEFLECVMAQHPASTGRFFVEGKRDARERQVAGRIARGIALVPEDRKRDGLIQIMAIRENLTLSSLKRFHPPFPSEPAEGSRARRATSSGV